MQRRSFISLLAGAASCAPAARAEQKPTPVIGVLGATTAAVYASRIGAFRDGLSETWRDKM